MNKLHFLFTIILLIHSIECYAVNELWQPLVNNTYSLDIENNKHLDIQDYNVFVKSHKDNTQKKICACAATIVIGGLLTFIVMKSHSYNDN